ncbi:unnamed protein product [Strongylus vulgaris]|uniref:Uncharacterized protein n=1 Tax=Strongylus vulgaris TaxID=40348 RepID=A0A3P7JM40_STRVU|nr:unnamed protein product [Strongylus vulgaris]
MSVYKAIQQRIPARHMSPYAIFVLLALLAITSAEEKQSDFYQITSGNISVNGPFDWNDYNYTSGGGSGSISVKTPKDGGKVGSDGQPGSDEDYHPRIRHA